MYERYDAHISGETQVNDDGVLHTLTNAANGLFKKTFYYRNQQKINKKGLFMVPLFFNLFSISCLRLNCLCVPLFFVIPYFQARCALNDIHSSHCWLSEVIDGETPGKQEGEISA